MNEKRSIIFDYCLHCNHSLAEVPQYSKYKAPRKFCNRSCAASYNNSVSPKRRRKYPPIEKVCPGCGAPFVTNLSGYEAIYCSQACGTRTVNARRNKDKVSRWLAGDFSDFHPEYMELPTAVRRYMLESADYACSACGWNETNPITGKVPLHIDHIDGDWGNPAKSNLRVLCPNCHSLTPNYGSLNKGNNTIDTIKRYRERV